MNENQIVYVLTNPAMPNMVKIGKTTQTDVEQRMSQLYSTGVPLPFECVYAVEVEDCSVVEQALHIAFHPNRVNPKREFFDIEPEQAIAVLKLLRLKEVTPQVNQQLNVGVSESEKNSAKKAKRRPNMNYVEMGIPIGSTLVYVEDDSITAEVISEKKVLFNGEEMSLTRATRIVLELDYSVQPAGYWFYNGKDLLSIYNETYTLEDF
ncbi:GIY-YIG nuclease family protein [Hydrogenovibrio crunogenus]|nr:GIY-YIG nuclease family protein [Hydrogenovibrio crunogenus]